MENRVQVKLTAEGLILAISTENSPISPAGRNANINFGELYANGRLNSELGAILKFSKIPNSLLGLAAAAHDHFAAKHLHHDPESFPVQPLRSYLSLLVSDSPKIVEEAAAKVIPFSHPQYRP